MLVAVVGFWVRSYWYSDCVFGGRGDVRWGVMFWRGEVRLWGVDPGFYEDYFGDHEPRWRICRWDAWDARSKAPLAWALWTGAKDHGEGREPVVKCWGGIEWYRSGWVPELARILTIPLGYLAGIFGICP